MSETWNKAEDLRQKREQAEEENRPPALEPAYPWPGIPLDPTMFDGVVLQSIPAPSDPVS